MYLANVRSTFDRSILASQGTIQPCTVDEVRRLEQELGHPLPTSYREFLLWMGHGAGAFLRGSDVFYQDVEPSLKEAAEDLLSENGISTRLPQDAFVFYMHQGYQFMFFRFTEGDDPPVYYYGEGEGLTTFRLLYEHFSVFLATEIEGHVRILSQLGQFGRNNETHL